VLHNLTQNRVRQWSGLLSSVLKREEGFNIKIIGEDPLRSPRRGSQRRGEKKIVQVRIVQPAAEQPLIVRSPKYSPAPCLHPRWYLGRRPLCIAIAATAVTRTRFASGLPLPTGMLLPPAIRLHASRLLAAAAGPGPTPASRLADSRVSPFPPL
jgi:hypothetical protein